MGNAHFGLMGFPRILVECIEGSKGINYTFNKKHDGTRSIGAVFIMVCV